MTAVFVDRHRRARRAGSAAALMFWLRVMPDVIAHGLAERREQRLLARRHQRRIAMWQSIVQDIRYAARTFGRRPGFTAAALLTLALGIGANTAIFSVVHAVLIRDLPYPGPDRIIRVFATHRAYNFDHGVLNPFDVTYVEEHATTLAHFALDRGCSTTLTGAGTPARLRCATVSPSFFDVMATPPAQGRAFSADEARQEAKVVMISHSLWRDRFVGRPDIIGLTISLDDLPNTIIGVMPPGFAAPSETVLWRPLFLTPAARADMGSWFLGGMARVRADASVDAATQEIARLGAEIEQKYPDRRRNRGLRAVSLQEDLGSRAAYGLRLLQGVVLCVLLIACANVANLLLAQAVARRREFGIRASIGGSRLRLLRQSLTESVVLAGVGAALGTAIAIWSVPALVAMAPPFLLPAADTIGVSWVVLGVTTLGAVLTGLAFGLGPALLCSAPALTDTLKDGERAAVAGLSWSRRQWLRASLVASEVALALVLLAGAGLLVRSFATLLAQAPGFQPDHVLAAQVTLPAARYPEPARGVFWSSLAERLRALPGVIDVGASNALPFSLWEFQADFQVRGREDVPNDGAGVRTVTPRLITTLGIPLLSGRQFAETDTSTSDRVVIVSDAFAKQHMQGLEPVGQQLAINRKDPAWATVVGVVGATRHLGLDEKMRPEIYFPLAQQPMPSTLLFAIRTTADAASYGPAFVDTLEALDPKLPVLDLKTMETMIGERTAERRFYMTLLTLFAALAVALAATGIYGVMSYVVTQARREIGIRLALGARPVQVRTRVLRQGLGVVAIGAAIGLVGAWSLSGLLEKQLFQITTGDPAAYAAAVLGLVTVAAIACWLPATRTTNIDPAIVLREG